VSGGARILALVGTWLRRAGAGGDVALAAVMVAILGALLVPLPSWLLDVGLALNLAASLTLLVAALQARSALRVSSFPTLLLLTTLLRLALNVSSTRLALSEGRAGRVIEAFGEFVVRGDFVVGGVVFAILTLVQFLVVTKGAERVAEVSARFTLDALPGKQMSIDADLRAGALTQEQGRARRRELERESQLFGAMDGAMKFVKGDALAGLVITAVNLVGGVLVGVFENGLGFGEAARTYALIAIGDGLVSQVPSLAIAVAAGVVVTRVASEREEDSLAAEIGAQLLGEQRVLWVVALLCGVLGLLPGMPLLAFGGLAAGLGLLAVRVARRPGSEAGSAARRELRPEAEAPRPEGAPAGVAPLLLDLAPDLGALVEEAGRRFVHQDLEGVRERLYRDLGVRAPAFRVRTGAPLPARTYRLAIDEVPAGAGLVPEGAGFCATPPPELARAGHVGRVVQDALGRSFTAVPAEALPALAAVGAVVTPGGALVAEHLLQLLRAHAAAFLGVEEVQAALTGLEASAPALVREAGRKVPLPLLADVLRRLLQEQVSVRNLRAVLEALVSPATEGDASQLAERCRAALARQLSHQHASGGVLLAYLVDPTVEEALRGAGGALEPSQAGAILEGLKRLGRPRQAVLLTSPDVRRMLRRLIEGSFPEVPVLTFNELDPALQVRPVGRLVAARATSAAG
jgi:type III secretion protein V